MSKRQRHLPVQGRLDPEYRNAVDLVRRTVGIGADSPHVAQDGVRRINRQHAQLTIVDGWDPSGNPITHGLRVRIPKGHPWRARTRDRIVLCSVVGCRKVAVSWLEFRGQAGHVHVCPEDEARDRALTDVVRSGPILRGHAPCPIIRTEVPTSLLPDHAGV